MSVYITVNWSLADHPEWNFTYTLGEPPTQPEEGPRPEPSPEVEGVLRMGSSTIAPGLSMQVA
jgi:hypothetical protein